MPTFTEKFDIVLVFVKAYDTAWTCELIKPYLADDGILVGVQNCMMAEQISEIVGPHRTCLLYTSDAADDRMRVDLGGRRIIKKSFFQAEDGIRDAQLSRGLGDVYKRQNLGRGSKLYDGRTNF